MRPKNKMLKGIISMLCAATMATPCFGASVGAVSEQEINAVIQNMDSCDVAIKKLENEKINLTKEKKIK